MRSPSRAVLKCDDGPIIQRGMPAGSVAGRRHSHPWSQRRTRSPWIYTCIIYPYHRWVGMDDKSCVPSMRPLIFNAICMSISFFWFNSAWNRQCMPQGYWLSVSLCRSLLYILCLSGVHEPLILRLNVIALWSEVPPYSIHVWGHIFR